MLTPPPTSSILLVLLAALVVERTYAYTDTFVYIVLLTTVILWKIVFIFPTITHKRKTYASDSRSSVAVIAHRGSRDEGLPENTIAAFTDACNAGADVIEFDVWLSLDGHVVIHHDDTFTRMTCNTNTHNITNTEIDDFPIIVPSGKQVDRCNCIKNKDDYERIPLLIDALRVIPTDTVIIIEFKQNSNELIDKVHKILNENQTRKRHTYWFSLIESINKKLRIKDDTIPTITSVTEMLKILIYYYTGVLPFVSIKADVFGITIDEIPIAKIRKEDALKSCPDWFKQILAFVFQGKPPHMMIAPLLFDHLRSRGIPVWFLGVNSEKDVLLASSTGATAILTDRVNWIVGYIKENNIKFKHV